MKFFNQLPFSAQSELAYGWNHSTKTGFTLIELVLVLVIISAVIAISFPQLSHSSRYREVQNEANKLRNFIQYVQTKARVDRRDYKIVFGENSYKYEYEDKDTQETVSSKIYTIPSYLKLINEGSDEVWLYPDRTSSHKISLKISNGGNNYIFKVIKEKGISRVEIREGNVE